MKWCELVIAGMMTLLIVLIFLPLVILIQWYEIMYKVKAGLKPNNEWCDVEYRVKSKAQLMPKGNKNATERQKYIIRKLEE